MSSDENLSSMSFSDQSTTVEYKEHAKLFGFIPVLVNIKVEAFADGTVNVHYLWYRFLLITNESDLKSDLETATQVTLDGTGAQANAALSATTQAQLVDRLHTVLKENFEASATTSSNVDVEVQ